MIPNRPLIVPTDDHIRQAFGSLSRAETPDGLVDFMATIGPIIGDPHVVRIIAGTVVDISAMKPPERKIRFLDNLMETVNFPPEVAREINRMVDRVVVPKSFLDLAERLVSPMHNLAGGVLEPPFPVSEEAKQEVATGEVSRIVYDEVMACFQTLREDLLHHVANGFLIYTVSTLDMRDEVVENSVKGIPERLAVLDLVGVVCGMTLHHPETWPEAATRQHLITMLNESKSRDTAIQAYSDDGGELTSARKVMAAIDDMIIDYCQRAIRSRNRDMRPVAFWRRVLHNSPLDSVTPAG